MCLEASFHGGDVVERLLHLCAEGVHQVGEVRQLGVRACVVELGRGLGQLVAELLSQLVESCLDALTSVVNFRADLVELVHDLKSVRLGRHLLLQSVDLVH